MPTSADIARALAIATVVMPCQACSGGERAETETSSMTTRGEMKCVNPFSVDALEGTDTLDCSPVEDLPAPPHLDMSGWPQLDVVNWPQLGDADEASVDALCAVASIEITDDGFDADLLCNDNEGESHSLALRSGAIGRGVPLCEGDQLLFQLRGYRGCSWCPVGYAYVIRERSSGDILLSRGVGVYNVYGDWSAPLGVELVDGGCTAEDFGCVQEQRAAIVVDIDGDSTVVYDRNVRMISRLAAVIQVDSAIIKQVAGECTDYSSFSFWYARM